MVDIVPGSPGLPCNVPMAPLSRSHGDTEPRRAPAGRPLVTPLHIKGEEPRTGTLCACQAAGESEARTKF